MDDKIVPLAEDFPAPDRADWLTLVDKTLKGGSPDVARIQREAAALSGLASQIPSWFPAGSGPDVHAKSRAKAEVWSDAATFRERAQAFEAESARFNAIAQAGDVEAIRAAVPALGNSCKNCHDRFRAPED